MVNKRKTFMFIYPGMGIGGIETFLIRLIRKLRKNNNRIIWLTRENRSVDKGFKKDLLDGYVEIINIKTDKLHWTRNENLLFNEGEEAVALAFNLVDFLRIENIKKEYKNITIDSFFWVPHFTGKLVFIERRCNKLIQPFIYRIIRRIIIKMEENENIFYVNRSHLEAFEKEYKYEIKNKNDKIYNGITIEALPYNHILARRRCKREEFNIITVSRFTFPHKAYVLGLIKTYGELKEKYKDLKLTIIGYGKDESRVIDCIEKLPLSAKKDIKLVGKVSYDDLQEYFNKAHLNIGVAGTIFDGALTGLISIPVRHYSEKCEAYGYLPDSRNKTTSNQPGTPIENYIEEVINMSEVEYLKLSEKAYYTYVKKDLVNELLLIMDKKNVDPKKTIKYSKIYFVRFYDLSNRLFNGIKNKLLKLFKSVIKF